MSNSKLPSWTTTMSFSIENNQELTDFMKKTCEQFKDFEELIRARITQLFDEHIDLPQELQEIGIPLMNLFSLGYQLGWNDHKNIEHGNETT